MSLMVRITMDELEQGQGTPGENEPQELDILRDYSGAFARVVLAAFGAVPWVAMIAVLSAEAQQRKINKVFQATLNDHKGKFDELQAGLVEMARRIDSLGDEAKARTQEDSYLDVVRAGFRIWDRCVTKDKRDRVFALLTNAASSSLAEDDIVRLFLEWIDRYHEAHFAVMRAVFNRPGITRAGIWREISGGGQLPAENSSKADLFRMLIHDLSTGRVIRQERHGLWDEHAGRWRKRPKKHTPKGPGDPYMESSFEDSKRYELSELGKDFLRYVLQAVTRIGDKDPPS